VWVDREGAETKTPVPALPYNEAAVSRGGTHVALVGGEGGVSDLWVADLQRGVVTRLTFGEETRRPVFTPDGSWIAYGIRAQRKAGNRWQIVWKPTDGSRPAEQLIEGERSHTPSGFTPDGSALLYDAQQPSGLARDIFLLPLAPPRKPRPLVEGPFIKDQAVVSPDGRFVAYVSDESGQSSVYVRPFPSGEGRYQISSGPGHEPRWSRDGRELFYRWGGVLHRVGVEAGREFRAGRPEVLFDRVATGGFVATYGPSPDGKRFLTFRSSAGVGSRTAVALDLGFGSRLAAGSSASGAAP
jgi:Tol biopolymer transport system component